MAFSPQIDTSDFYIPSIDGKDLYLSNHYLSKSLRGYNLKRSNGKYNLSRFINTLDFSLDAVKLKEVYEKVYRRKDFFFNHKEKAYTQFLINVTFKYSDKAYNHLQSTSIDGFVQSKEAKEEISRNKKNKKKISGFKKYGTFIKSGYSASEIHLKHCVDVRNGELIAIQIGEQVDEENTLLPEQLGKYFSWVDGVYKQIGVIKVLHNVADIRDDLYEHGFICDGRHYIRFKRSSGSSRVGKCLFIDEQMYRLIHLWEMCGLKIRKGQIVDLAALESYIALTLSSIIDTIQIRPENILVIEDYESIFEDRVAATRLVDGRLKTEPETVTIKNSLWDGQSILDYSMFGKYAQYGMLLLRGRFFKSCCFNTNIQQWFADHDITEISQLNGITHAKCIGDIKLITTPSSIKFLKFGGLDDWLWNMDSTFGIVKHEKPTHFFEGRMVQTHYQLLNSLQLSKDDTKKFLQPSLEYLSGLRNDPDMLRYHIKYQFQEIPDTSTTDRCEIIYRMLGINNDFTKTKMYAQFRDDIVKSFRKDLRKGHILVNGNYSVLCGNPIEMLQHSIGRFNGKGHMHKNTIYSTRFPDGQDLLGSRSPHVNSGNVLIAKNRYYKEIDRYFNFTEEIVSVNSINESLLDRLSGSDFDSDSLLLTDNTILLEAAKKNYDRFLVPVKLVQSIKSKRKYTSKDKTDLDIKTAVNKIGEIINLSQVINSKMWDMIYQGRSEDEYMELYYASCQLDVMSNLEIDSAKRENPADNIWELKQIKNSTYLKDSNGNMIKPMFFKYLDGYKGFDNSGGKVYRNFHTTMDYIQNFITESRFPRSSPCDYLKFSEILISPEKCSGTLSYKHSEKIIHAIRDLRHQTKMAYATNSDAYTQEELKDHENEVQIVLKEARKDCILKIEAINLSQKTMRYLLSHLDCPKSTDIRKTLMTYLFKYKHGVLWDLIKSSVNDINMLVESPQGCIELFDFNFEKNSVRPTE